jgi:hypothetical protein
LTILQNVTGQRSLDGKGRASSNHETRSVDPYTDTP